MKIALSRLTFAVACAAGVPLAAVAQSTVTIYGRLDTSLESTKTGSLTQTQVRDNASRVGFRGTEDLGGGLNAVFGLEMGFASDTGAATTPAYRNSYVGLTGGFGAVAVGRLDSANPTGSPIYSLITRHTEFVIHDAGATAIGTSVLNSRNRESNAIGYISPKFGDVVFRARYYMNGEGVAEVPVGPVRFESDIKQTDLSLSYGEGKGPFGLGVAYGQDKRNGGATLNTFKDKWMLVGAYDFGTVKAWAVAGRDNYQGASTTRSQVNIRLVGASLKVGNSDSKVVANYMTRDVQSDPNGTLKKFQLGYAHPLSKRSMLYAFYDRQDPNSRLPNDTIRSVGVGIQHNF
ncbi:Outer membrane protein (porin) [Polaromonas sp. OV174]|uniref:porin n=1 Tax=Polaromonas sp. OV174 TaxID=1855300 RepID=UPI0008EA0341|nr:porin [Polaromonas sp. OV174]SFC53418.1 Outer membrane protein (porin) [Polaromonas sp. OV174]